MLVQSDSPSSVDEVPNVYRRLHGDCDGVMIEYWGHTALDYILLKHSVNAVLNDLDHLAILEVFYSIFGG